MTENVSVSKFLNELDQYLPYLVGIFLVFVFLIIFSDDEELGLFYLGIVVLLVVLEYYRNKRFNRIEELLESK